MNGNTYEILDLVARWVHVVAGIMWVGNSLLFNWLDRSLVPANAPGQTRKPIGTIWLLHSGGFYYVEKTLLEGEEMPAPLHWFKWQAYTTWFTGFALLLIVYYAGGRASMVDSSAHGLNNFTASLIGLGSVFGGWALYEVMQRFVAPRAPNIAAVIWVAALIGIAVWLTQILSGRAAFLHVGAMLATIMAGNVFWTIVPSQRELVASASGGHGADPAISARAKRVSIHNNYFTFPVIALMVSNHFPALYGNRLSWLILLVVVALGAGVRHVLNVRWTMPLWKPALGGVIAAGILSLWAILTFGIAPEPIPAASSSEPVTFADVRHVIDRRCAVCHSERPTDITFGSAPTGVKFDTEEQIIARAARIRERAFVLRSMPPANKTGISDAEREILGRWAAQQIGLH
ncbi:MAG: urate hydroxylase PuuD [Gemmatimonadaceae bacterium]